MAADESSPAARQAPIDLEAAEFRAVGHALVDRIAEYLEQLPGLPVTRGASPRLVRDALGRGGLPEAGRPLDQLLAEITPLLIEHSLHNGHPRFWGYITSSANPAGALAELLAAAINPNLGRWDIAPIASEIEAQTVRWLAELVGYPADCGGILTSGGNMANFLAFVAARRAQATWDIRREGLYGEPRKLTAYVSAEAHTWVDKAADVSGLGSDAVRWVSTDRRQRMRPDDLATLIRSDRRAGLLPFLVVGTAGTTATGAIDPLPELAEIARRERLWFHVDGAYGAPAATLAAAPTELRALGLADSLALDPHKWLYAPLEAACCLVRDPQALPDAFSFQPSYYKLDRRADEQDGRPGINYYQYGMQNSRGFRALKVWLGLRQVGRAGVARMIGEDIELARQLYELAAAHPDLEARSHSLSITTFRYRPRELTGRGEQLTQYLNKLNEQLLDELQRSGRAFLSNAVVAGDYLLRACVVNFRSSARDIEALPGIVCDIAASLDARSRPAALG